MLFSPLIEFSDEAMLLLEDVEDPVVEDEDIKLLEDDVVPLEPPVLVLVEESCGTSLKFSGGNPKFEITPHTGLLITFKSCCVDISLLLLPSLLVAA